MQKGLERLERMNKKLFVLLLCKLQLIIEMIKALANDKAKQSVIQTVYTRY